MGSPVFCLMMFWEYYKCFKVACCLSLQGIAKNGIPWRWGGKLFCNVCKYTTVVAVSYAQRLETSSALLWEPQLYDYKLHVCAAFPQFLLFTILPFFPPLVISICLWFFYIYPHFFLPLKQIFKPTLNVIPVYIFLTVTLYVLLSRAETFSALKRKSCQRSCTYLLKKDLSAQQIHFFFTVHKTSSPTSVQRSKINDTAFVVSVVLCHYFTKFKITKVQNSCQDTINCIHFIIMKSQKTEACIQLVVPLHVCL